MKRTHIMRLVDLQTDRLLNWLSCKIWVTNSSFAYICFSLATYCHIYFQLLTESSYCNPPSPKKTEICLCIHILSYFLRDMPQCFSHLNWPQPSTSQERLVGWFRFLFHQSRWKIASFRNDSMTSWWLADRSAIPKKPWWWVPGNHLEKVQN